MGQKDLENRLESIKHTGKYRQSGLLFGPQLYLR